MSNFKYQSLIKVLDKVISDAPQKLRAKRYSVINEDKINSSRSLAYIHLYLMARHGITDFSEREIFITDDSYDGGIDAYYIDESASLIYLIQSKFRTNSENFSNKDIEIDELLSMDVNRIIKGEERDENGNCYNGRIKGFQRALGLIRNIGKYECKVIILANTKYTEAELNKVTGGFECEVFNHSLAYEKLLFPVISGSYFDPSDLDVSINLANSEHPRIKYRVDLGEVKSDITVLFVPTLEIAKILYKYKNSILKYNPRSYLEMRRNSVNDDIANTIKNCNNNEFALFNNGITMISKQCFFSEYTGTKNRASLSLKNPQIINGGQTAYTLSRLYEDNLENESDILRLFDGKEVLVKIISFISDENEDDIDKLLTEYNESQFDIVEKISKATNSQNPIDEADRKANDKYQIVFQRYAFIKTGLYYERKRGEFADGIRNKYIDREQVIKRDDLIRCCLSSIGKAGEARRANKKYLFSPLAAERLLRNNVNHDKYLTAYQSYLKLKEIEKKNRNPNDKYSVSTFGSGLRYGKYAVISASLKSNCESTVESILSRWISFEAYVLIKHKNKHFKTDDNMLNYYKSSDVNDDVLDFF